MDSQNYNVVTNICYVLDDKGRVLLQKKARGVGQGKWNGPGGKQEPDETIEDSVHREIWEETGLKLLNPEIKGELGFVCPNGDNFFSYVFVAKEFQGEPRDKGEGELRWFDIEDIPLEKMWDDDKYWLKRLLGGEYVKMKFFFDENGKVDFLNDYGKVNSQQ